VVARNWRCSDGEIDLILERGRSYVFCEVKTRSSDAFGVPAGAVTPTKQARIRRVAARWLREQARIRRGASSRSHRAAEIRFDVAAILSGHLEVIEAAF
jgi:putative endonuclease